MKLKPLALPNTGKNNYKIDWLAAVKRAREAFSRTTALPEPQTEADRYRERPIEYLSSDGELI